MAGRRSGVQVEALELPGEPILRERAPDDCALVIFGITGDLAVRKLLPALYRLHLERLLPHGFAVVGVARSATDVEALRKKLGEGVAGAAGSAFDPAAWARLAERIDAVAGGSADLNTYGSLEAALERAEQRFATRGNRLYYLSLPPSVVPPTLQGLRAAGLAGRGPASENGEKAPWRRVVLEKPFGRDLATSRELDREVDRAFHESQVFRIDHYLGKETVQNLLVFRFGNGIFESLWSRHHVDHVQITMAETLGVEGRGGFYDANGVLRDVVQNHLMQVLALCAMDAPVSFEAEELRRRKGDVLRALRPFRGDVGERVALGQYAGYRDEPAVAPDSRTPTFAALELFVDNWRWQGVPFYLRTGKRLARRVTEVAIHFRPVPLCLFPTTSDCQQIEPNVLRLRIQPDEGIALSFATKVPGEGLSVGRVAMDFHYHDAFDRAPREAYERLLLDCMRGDPTLFLRRDEVELAWSAIDPVIAWAEAEDAPPPSPYAVGSAGPAEAECLPTRSRRSWERL